jgi:hypothetical protein
MRTKSRFIIVVASLILFSYACRKESKKSDLILWYNQPAARPVLNLIASFSSVHPTAINKSY